MRAAAVFITFVILFPAAVCDAELSAMNCYQVLCVIDPCDTMLCDQGTVCRSCNCVASCEPVKTKLKVFVGR